MFFYGVYGLGIRSELPLPELTALDRGDDVSIRIAEIERPGLPRQSGSELDPDADTFTFWNSTGAYSVRGGSEILVSPDSASSAESVRLNLLGAALAVVLQHRGGLVLHASAVVIDGGVVLFAGDSGWGKSTTAAAFDRAGYPIASDDITSIEFDGDIPVAPAGFPQLKVWPDAAAALGHRPDSLPQLVPGLDKLALRARGVGFGERFRVLRIYILDRTLEANLQPVTGTEALVELVRHSYAARLLKTPEAGAWHHRQCARLVNTVPVRRIRAGHSLERLDELVDSVRNDL